MSVDSYQTNDILNSIDKILFSIKTDTVSSLWSYLPYRNSSKYYAYELLCLAQGTIHCVDYLIDFSLSWLEKSEQKSKYTSVDFFLRATAGLNFKNYFHNHCFHNINHVSYCRVWVYNFDFYLQSIYRLVDCHKIHCWSAFFITVVELRFPSIENECWVITLSFCSQSVPSDPSVMILILI